MSERKNEYIGIWDIYAEPRRHEKENCGGRWGRERRRRGEVREEISASLGRRLCVLQAGMAWHMPHLHPAQ